MVCFILFSVCFSLLFLAFDIKNIRCKYFPVFFFREVFNFEKYRDEAFSVFLAHKGAMHPVTSGLVAKDLKADGSNTTSL